MITLAIFAMALTLAMASLEANWLVYKKTYNKGYTEDEDAARRVIWQTNVLQIEAHNELYAQGLSSFYMKENKFTDMTNEEVSKLMKGLKLPQKVNPGNYQSGLSKGSLPDAIDWRKKGAVTPVKDQGQCGSCWAFSTTGTVEGAHFKATGQLISLSESNLVDCSNTYATGGCSGADPFDALQYIINNTGIDTEDSYPYTPVEEKCKFKPAGIGSTLKSFTNITSGSEDELQKAVAEIGPVSICIDANHKSFQHYGGGIYYEPDCDPQKLDHCVLAVGYGSEQSKDYWIVKNSWSKIWGEQGYIRMSRNMQNQCGVASHASYPTA